MASVRTLYRLQTVDQALASARERLREIEERLAGNEKLQALQRSVDSLESQVSRSRAQVRDLELEIQSLSEKMSDVHERLYGGQVTNPRELESLQDEMEYLGRRQRRLEDDLLEAMILLDEQAVELRDHQERLNQAAAEWQEEQTSLRDERAELEAQERQLKTQRSVLQEELQPEELSMYEDLRRRENGVAVVLLQDGACGGCGVRLPTSTVQQVRQAEDMQFCPSCGRILCSR
ncbi:MAG: C4-type zinc ribbon domain-containing protein [Chloroflexota bacterium]|nr:C4-type zinc ribbon domain-containing protein [Chloroflexota bacterium]